MRSATASPTPSLLPGQSPRSSPRPRIQRPLVDGILHVGLSGKIRVVRADVLSHQADMIISPSDHEISSSWNNLTKRIHEAAGPLLQTTLDNRYHHGQALHVPPCELPDADEVNSPLGSYFNAVKHTSSFEMMNCDWLAHSYSPLYSVASNAGIDDPEAYDFFQIGIRNNRKYCSIVLALKRAHRVVIETRPRTFTVAVPQFQYDGGQFTPRDDAVLTTSALVNFFNHPTWGARRYNAISHVDVLIEPEADGLAYANAYEFAWQ